MKKTLMRISMWLVCLVLMVQTGAAANDLSVSHNLVKGNMLYAYVDNPGTYESVRCQVGVQASPSVQVQDISDEGIALKTYILIDNSLSIQEKYRDILKQTAKNIISARRSNESITVATFDRDIHYIAEDSQDIGALGQVVDQIVFQNQYTQVYNALYQLYDKIEDEDENCFKRVILMSDGAEDSAIGYTKEEVIEKVKACAYPIYTLGCTYKSNEAELENMFRVSRVTNAEYYYLDEVESAEQVATGITSALSIVRVQVEIPESQMDGSPKGIQIVFQGEGMEKSASFTQLMPFASIPATPMTEDMSVQTELPTEETEVPTEIPTEVPTEESTEIPTEVPTEAPTEAAEITEAVPVTESNQKTESETDTIQQEDDSNIILLVAGIAAVLVVICLAIIVIILLRNKNKGKERREKEPEKEEELTEIVKDENGDKTEILNGNEDAINIRLTDIKRPSMIREFSLADHVVIGRSQEKSQIVFEYEKSVSGQHCEISRKGKEIYIKDLNSSNLTFVDGTEVKREMRIEDGSIIKMGRLQVQFQVISDGRQKDSKGKAGSDTEGIFDF